MKALVTGVAGFIGSQLAEQLVAEGAEVIGVDCFTPFYAREDKDRNLSSLMDWIDFVEGDLVTCDLDRLLDGVTHVFHLAAQAGVRGSWGLAFADYLHHNVLGTQRLLDACRGRDLRSFVYASSSSVYGECHAPVDERTACVPLSPYGETKRSAEDICRIYWRTFQVPVVALRYFTVYGPRQRPDMGIRRFIEAALDGRGVTVFGDGLQRREFTYVGDVVRATMQAARAASWGTVYNIAGGTHCSVLDLVIAVSQAVGVPVQVEYAAAQPGDVANTRANTDRVRLDLNWFPLVSLTRGLAAEVAWCRERRKEAQRVA